MKGMKWSRLCAFVKTHRTVRRDLLPTTEGKSNLTPWNSHIHSFIYSYFCKTAAKVDDTSIKWPTKIKDIYHLALYRKRLPIPAISHGL